MSNFHRVIWFDQQVKSRIFPNRMTLAEKFEISVRQAQRDIDYLKDRMGAPLKYDGKRRGFYYDDDTFVLPNIFINEDLKRLLNYMAYSYENFTQTPKAVEIGKLLRKLADEEDFDEEVPIFDLEKTIIQTFYKIYNCIRTKNKMRVHYDHPHRGNILLTISPYKIFHKYKADYFTGFSEEDKGFITLRLDRVSGIDMLVEKFEPDPLYDEAQYSNLIKKEPFTASIEFAKPPSFSEGVRIKQVDGTKYTLEFFEIEDFINQLFNMEYWERIYFPKWLKEKMRDRCEQTIKKLGL